MNKTVATLVLAWLATSACMEKPDELQCQAGEALCVAKSDETCNVGLIPTWVEYGWYGSVLENARLLRRNGGDEVLACCPVASSADCEMLVERSDRLLTLNGDREITVDTVSVNASWSEVNVVQMSVSAGASMLITSQGIGRQPITLRTVDQGLPALLPQGTVPTRAFEVLAADVSRLQFVTLSLPSPRAPSRPGAPVRVLRAASAAGPWVPLDSTLVQIGPDGSSAVKPQANGLYLATID